MKEIDINKLQEIKGQELKYKELCEGLDMPYISGKSKQIQMNDLKLYCNYDILDHPTRYIITEVYPEPLTFLLDINKNNKYQLGFDAALYNAFIKNNGADLYMSQLDLLSFFGEINANFKLALDKNNFIKMELADFTYMSDFSKTVYKILSQWTNRRIYSLKVRSIIEEFWGFRLYYWHNEYPMYINVPLDSEVHRKCREIFTDSSFETLPNNWNGEWLNDYVWGQFKNKINELTKERFDGQYFSMKRIRVFRPHSLEWLKDKVKEIYENAPELKDLNNIAKDKILNTKQLNKFTGEQKEQFIDYNISPTPPLWFKERLYKNQNP